MSLSILPTEIRKPTHAGAFSSANSVFWEPPGPPTNFEKCAGNLGKLWGTSKEPLKKIWELLGNLRGTSGDLRGTSRDLRGTSGEPPGNLRTPVGETPGAFLGFLFFFITLRFFVRINALALSEHFFKCLALEHRSSHRSGHQGGERARKQK